MHIFHDPRPLRGFAGGAFDSTGLRRWRAASYMTMAPATDRLSEEHWPAMGIRRGRSQVFLPRAWRRAPSRPRPRTYSGCQSRPVEAGVGDGCRRARWGAGGGGRGRLMGRSGGAGGAGGAAELDGPLEPLVPTLAGDADMVELARTGSDGLLDRMETVKNFHSSSLPLERPWERAWNDRRIEGIQRF